MKKIMFNDRYKLTEAVLSGRKTQTRRIVPRSFFTDNEVDINDKGIFCEDMYGDWHDIRKTKYAFKIGEIVAIAQCYKDFWDADKVLYRSEPITGGYIKQTAAQQKGWANKMFVCADLMPHQIRITNVRVERLKDISNEDCLKEGIGISATDNRVGYPFGIPFNYFVGEDKESCRYSTPREAYAALIDKVSGKGTWESNPYVFVYDFELVK